MHHNLSKLIIFIVYFRYAMNCRLRRQENREKLETQVWFWIIVFNTRKKLVFPGTQRIFKFEICNEILVLGFWFQKITLLPSKSVRSTYKVPIHPSIKVASWNFEKVEDFFIFMANFLNCINFTWIENPRETGILSGSSHVSIAFFIIRSIFILDEKSKGKICH